MAYFGISDKEAERAWGMQRLEGLLILIAACNVGAPPRASCIMSN